MDLPASPSRAFITVVGAGMLTAGGYFLSFGHHRSWWPVWIALLPVLLLAPQLRSWQVFLVAVIARASGALSMWNCIHHVVQLSLLFTVITILIPSIVFAIAIIVYRGILRKSRFVFASGIVSGGHGCG
jgi:apolipoprotein N-acyltransferase